MNPLTCPVLHPLGGASYVGMSSGIGQSTKHSSAVGTAEVETGLILRSPRAPRSLQQRRKVHPIWQNSSRTPVRSEAWRGFCVQGLSISAVGTTKAGTE